MPDTDVNTAARWPHRHRQRVLTIRTYAATIQRLIHIIGMTKVVQLAAARIAGVRYRVFGGMRNLGHHAKSHTFNS